MMQRARSCRAMGVPGLVIAAGLVLAGCQGRSFGLNDKLTTASTAAPSLQEVAETGKRWESDRGNVGLGLAYSSQLNAIGQTDRQLEVLRTLAERNAGDLRITALYGRELARAGRAGEAAQMLERAAAAQPADWKLRSALGSAYDQQGRYAEARAQYEAALAIKPDEITVLNNIGMSHALEGDLKTAEATLRRASALPAAASEPRVRQNLALVIGLQGRFDEARQVAARDLPPEQVEANMAYLKKMLAEPDTWQQLKQGAG